MWHPEIVKVLARFEAQKIKHYSQDCRAVATTLSTKVGTCSRWPPRTRCLNSLIRWPPFLAPGLPGWLASPFSFPFSIPFSNVDGLFSVVNVSVMSRVWAFVRIRVDDSSVGTEVLIANCGLRCESKGRGVIIKGKKRWGLRDVGLGGLSPWQFNIVDG